MRRWVLHIDMDAFYASCEQLTRPTLRGRPVLVGGVSGRGVVAGCSYEARVLGAHSAMPMYQARTLVGYRGVTVAPRAALYKHLSRKAFEVFAEFGGVVEQVSIDEAFLEPEAIQDLEPEQVRTWVEQMRAAVRKRTGLTASVGCGPGKQIAKIGSGLAKPDGVALIPQESLASVIHPLPVGKLWGVGPVTRQKLGQLGIETIGDLAAMTQREVDISLGATVGRALWMMARGHDDRPVEVRKIAKQISAEHTYPKDLTSIPEVDAALERAANDAHRRLLHDGRGARTITVKLKMADFHTESRSATLDYATDNLDTLKAMAKKLLRYPDDVGPIRLVGVGFSGLDQARQDVLFPELDQVVSTERDVDYEAGVRDHHAPIEVVLEQQEQGWKATQDVVHPEFGHGWIQGIGLGKLTVRFETRSTGVGRVKTFDASDPALQPGDPLDSLA
ncbi:DNA polymerase IV [Corynebacterium pseudopelargi]|uniref:DNA polymerase IV n=1 Tax=Corynebacterium pseudopelargi TaxID=2080757 RepID=A0A3G6ITJ5_9CORY|nr:DNA polymerase IV [Corynebacterium pseudopelargi]AZA08937.1 DNA polymerase IV [Corynebacterium pseudopelargi]